MPLRQSQACSRLSALGLRQDQVHGILNQVKIWKDSSGAEWTVKRLKDLKTVWLQRAAGDEPEPSTWLSLHPDGSPKGPFRPLFSEGRSFKQRAKALNALMIYTSEVRVGNPTEKQWEKFQKSVEEPPEENLTGVSVASPVSAPVRMGRAKEVFHYQWRTHKHAPGRQHARTVLESEFSKQFEYFRSSAVNRRVAVAFKAAYINALTADLYSRLFETMPREEHPDGVGRISFIQEPGWKLRAVANPHRFHQVALEPLKQGLFKALKDIPEDCTFEQRKGVDWAHEQLKLGKRVHSVDLSDATNSFPLSLTEKVLRSSCEPEAGYFIDLFLTLSRSPWVVFDPALGKEREMTWKKGQPLGLGPSFAAFALTHHSVMKGLQKQVGGDYRILGDDIVIIGDKLAKAYYQTMSDLGVRISKDKSYSSYSLAEFAGKIITPEGIIPTAKWRQMSDRNFLEYTEFFGPTFVSALRPRQRQIVDLLAPLPQSIGGLGWNPKGIPLVDRLNEHREVVEILRSRDEVAWVPAQDSSLPTREIVLAGLSTGFAVPPFVAVGQRRPDDKIVEGTPSYSGQHGYGPSKAETESRTDSLISRIVRSVHLHSGMFPEDNVPLTPAMIEDGDPRGSSTLKVLEEKLQGFIPDQKGKKNVTRQPRHYDWGRATRPIPELSGKDLGQEPDR